MLVSKKGQLCQDSKKELDAGWHKMKTKSNQLSLADSVLIFMNEFRELRGYGHFSQLFVLSYSITCMRIVQGTSRYTVVLPFHSLSNQTEDGDPLLIRRFFSPNYRHESQLSPNLIFFSFCITILRILCYSGYNAAIAGDPVLQSTCLSLTLSLDLFLESCRN